LPIKLGRLIDGPVRGWRLRESLSRE
jgi:hypothetical protein